MHQNSKKKSFSFNAKNGRGAQADGRNWYNRKITEPTECCVPMVLVQKSNGKLRICVDLRRLNSAVKDSRFVLPTLEDIAPKLAGTRYFSKLDTSSELWQIPLHPDVAKLTTFMTPFGRFCFKRLAFGITSTPEIFQYLISDLLKNR